MSKAVWCPEWPQNLIFFVDLRLMEVLNVLLTNKFLQNSAKKFYKILQKSEHCIFLNIRRNSVQVRTLFSPLFGPSL